MVLRDVWEPRVQLTEQIWLDDLRIAFHRTVRVPDNQRANELPPSEGLFPLYQVDDYAQSLPPKMAQKGGLFFPMYQREAMWIEFGCTCPRYVIKLFVGNVNAISGEPAVETSATKLRRRNLLNKGKSIQDYVVVPGQLWLDGVAVEPGKVRQFIAMPFGTGYSVEDQVTGQETTGGLQFEITRLCSSTYQSGKQIELYILYTVGPAKTLRIGDDCLVEDLRTLIQDKIRIPSNQQRLVWSAYELKDGKRLCDYHIPTQSRIHVLGRLRGGGEGPGPAPEPEMNIAAGGLIEQNIFQLAEEYYEKSTSVTFNVQILNSASFQVVTGLAPPPTPISAATYASSGLPFFSIYEEPSDISGDFSMVRSIAQIDGTTEAPLRDLHVHGLSSEEPQTRRSHEDEAKASTNRVGILNPDGPMTPVDLSWQIAEELNKVPTVTFWKAVGGPRGRRVRGRRDRNGLS